MKRNWIIFVFLLASLLFACEDPPEKRKESEKESDDQKVEQNDNEKNKHEHQHSVKDPAEGANEHMHKRSVEDLIQAFESDERDAYQKPKEVLDYIGGLSGKKVIDIGAGSGYFSVKLAGRGAQVIAADVNEEFQEYIRLRIAQEGLKERIEPRLIPYDSPKLEPNEVDMALIVNTYHHIQDRVPYFSEVKEGLKKSGELIVIDFFKVEAPVGPPVDHKLSMDVVIDELKKAGYKKMEAEVSLLPYQYIIRAQ